MKKIKVNHSSRITSTCVLTVVVMLLLLISGNCIAAQFVRIKMYPEHVGVFTTVKKQQFVAFGYKADGSTVNITKLVDWKSSNNNIVTINRRGLATVVAGRTFGQVKITCSYPKVPKPPKLISLAGPYILLLKKPVPSFLPGIYLLLIGKRPE